MHFPSLLALAWQDHAVIGCYLVGMICFGAYLARRQRTDEEYFLAGRSMPWFAVGVSVIASLLSSLTYLSEPGEVWNSGVTHVFGKMIAIPFEMLIVWIFCVPFMMRFRFTSAYEYLEHRFGPIARLLGASMFIAMVVLWMGFVVLASARALAAVSGFQETLGPNLGLFAVIATVGFVATLYTYMGGLRAVIWTDVVQVTLLVGGGLFTIFYIAYATDTGLGDWLASASAHLSDPRVHQAAIESGQRPPETIQFFSADPFVRVTIVTVAINMCIWHVCTHVGNQMTVQRYFSTANRKAARRSFVTGSLIGVGLNLMLVVVGLAVLFYYYGQANIEQTTAAEATGGIETGASPELYRDIEGLNPSLKKDRDLIFSTFAVTRLPAGFGGAILAALLAAAMSSIDSGVNSIATVVSVEWRHHEELAAASQSAAKAAASDHVGQAKWITLAAGGFITLAAFGLNFLPSEWGIVDAMPRTFNAITGPLGGLFLVGMFIPSAGQRSAVAATALGMATSIGIGYFKQIGGLLHGWGLLAEAPASLSFTWVMPWALAVTLVSAFLLSFFEPRREKSLAGLTWFTRKEASPLTDHPDS